MSERKISLSVEDVKAAITGFCRLYPVAFQVAYRVRNTIEELYGPKSSLVPSDLTAGFTPGYYDAHARFHRGRCDIPASSIHDVFTLEETLRHELLGHFGINTFMPEDKRSILNAIVAARDQPVLDARWVEVDELYKGKPELVRAEEVYAFACEDIEFPPSVQASHVMRALDETCIRCTRAMQMDDLALITRYVAACLHDCSCRQQTFPVPGEQFRVMVHERNAGRP